jgi:phenylalanyl-tRNA synthetase beta chain
LAPISAKIRPESQKSPFALRHEMAARAYQETINFSFVDERWERELAGNAHPIKLLNPITSQMSVMRSSLLGSLLQVLKFNLDRKTQRVRIFEIGRVFLRDPSVQNTDTTVEGFHQPMKLAGMVYGSQNALQWGRKEQGADFFDVKGDIESLMAPLKPSFQPAEHPSMHPGRCASICISGQMVGYVGELHPKWRQSYDLASAPIMFELELDVVLQRTVPVFKNVAKHQAVERDLAVMVDEKITHAELMASIWAAPTLGLLRDATLFDVYRPKPTKDTSGLIEQSFGKSLAVRLKLNSDDSTLTEEQIDAAVQSVLDALVRDVGARQRA